MCMESNEVATHPVDSETSAVPAQVAEGAAYNNNNYNKLVILACVNIEQVRQGHTSCGEAISNSSIHVAILQDLS